MGNSSRGLREAVVRGLAKVGLVWAVAVLGALFMTMSAQGQRDDAYALSSADSHSTFSASSDRAPHMAGLALALFVLGAGVVVLAVGATRGDRGLPFAYPDADADTPIDEPSLDSDLPLALGVVLLA